MSTSAKRKRPRKPVQRTAHKRGTKGVPSDPARPIDPAVLARATALAESYQVVVWFEDGEWYGEGVELPGSMGDGPTPNDCVAAVREAMTLTVVSMIEHGQSPPPQAREGVRTEQVNVRLTATERLALETKARQYGHKGLSDFVRAAAMGGGR